MYGQTTSPHMAEHLHSIRLFSNAINTGWLFWDAFQLYNSFYVRDFSLLTLKSANGAMAAALAFEAFLTLSRSLFHWITAADKPSEELLNGIPAEKKPSVSLRFKTPEPETSGKIIYVARIVMNLATACLSSKQSLQCALTAAGLTYSLLKTTQLKWLAFSRQFDYPRQRFLAYDEIAPKNFVFSYSMPLFINQSTEGKCVICQDDKPSSFFCPYTPMDEACIVATIFNTSDRFDQNLKLSCRRVFTNNSGTKISHHANIKILQKNLPKCPSCNNYPSTHSIEAQYRDWNINQENGGYFQTNLDVIPDPAAPQTRPLLSETFWTRLGIIYNTFQLALASLQQRHSEIANKILSLQRYLNLLDAGLLIQNYIQLYQTLYTRYVQNWVQLGIPKQRLAAAEQRVETARLAVSNLTAAIEGAQEAGEIIEWQGQMWVSEQFRTQLRQYGDPGTEYVNALDEKEKALKEQEVARKALEKRYRIGLYVIMGLGAAALAAASANIVSLIHRMPSAYNLTDLLNKIATPEDFKNLKVSWSIPAWEYISQCLLVNNIVVNLALAYFSTYPLSYLSNAFIQSLTLLKVSKLAWIVLERRFTFTRGSSWDAMRFIKYMTSLHSSFEFFLPPFTPGNVSHPTCNTYASFLEASLKTVYNFTTEFFKNSSCLGRYWDNETFTYDVIVKPSLLRDGAYTVVPLLQKVTAWAQDMEYGKAVVNITTSPA